MQMQDTVTCEICGELTFNMDTKRCARCTRLIGNYLKLNKMLTFINALDPQADEEIIVTFTKRKKL